MRVNKYIILYLTLLAASETANGKVIEMMREKVTQVIFPSSIKTVKGGFIPDDFVMDIQENVLYIQPIDSFPESNINVVTTDNAYYTFTIRYNGKNQAFNHIIKLDQALLVANDTRETITEKKSDTNIPDKILKDNDPPSGKAVRYKTTYMYLRGVYAEKDKLYIKLSFENQSNIPYDFEYVGFYIKERKQRKNATQEQVQLTPENVHPDTGKHNSIKPNGSIEKVYTFPKFTIGKEKLLLIDMIEKGGERNLSLKIDDTTLLKARKHEN